MRRSSFTEAQIIAILKPAEGGAKVSDLAREHGTSTQTIYSWRAKFGGLDVSEAKRLKELEDENRRSEADGGGPVARQGGSEVGARKKVVSPAGRRAVVEHFRADFAMSERRACGLVGQSRLVQQYRSTATPIECLLVNHKRIRRLNQSRGLAVRRRKRQRASPAPRESRPPAEVVNDCWSMDFLLDSTTDGRALRVLAVVDDHPKLCTALKCDISLPAQRALRILDRAIESYGAPKRTRTDNASKFTSRSFDQRCYERGIEHHPIRPGKPVEDADAVTINGRVRDELQSEHCFTGLRRA